MRKLNNEQRQLVEDNYNLIFYVMGKYNFTKQIEYEDCYGALAEGLCNAAATFDNSRGAAFSSYAVRCMVNAVFMFTRKVDKPQDFLIVSMDSPINGDGTLLVADLIPDDTDYMEGVENSEAINKALSEVKDRWDGIAHSWRAFNRYDMLMMSVRGDRQVDIARKLGVSQSSVSHSMKSIKGDLSNALMKQGIMM